MAAEQWRKDFGVEEIVNNFDFKEKAEVDKYYPQYYHKSDKVNLLHEASSYLLIQGWSSDLHRASRQTRLQGIVFNHDAGTPTATSSLGIRKVYKRAVTSLFSSGGSPRRNILHHPRSGKRRNNQLLQSQGLRYAGCSDWTG